MCITLVRTPKWQSVVTCRTTHRLSSMERPLQFAGGVLSRLLGGELVHLKLHGSRLSADQSQAFEDLATQFVRDIEGELAVVGPNGAAECSHGWSVARVLAGEAQPVERIALSDFCPGGAEESRDNPAHQSNTYLSSNLTPWAWSIRKSSDLKSSLM